MTCRHEIVLFICSPDFFSSVQAVGKVIASPVVSCRIRIVGPRQIPLKKIKEYYEKPNFVNATSRASEVWMRGLSPFFLGPCELHDGKFTSNFMENAWQFTKVFPGSVRFSDLSRQFLNGPVSDMRTKQMVGLLRSTGTGPKRVGNQRSQFASQWARARNRYTAGIMASSYHVR